jgi:hypothetical protein
VIVSLHVATGGLLGLATRSRAAALLLGPALHVAGDHVPHQDIASRPFEIGSGVFCLVLLAARRGPLDPVTLGAASASAPDLEHVIRGLRPRGQKLFHRGGGAHRPLGGLPATTQLVAAGALVGFLLGLRVSRR